MPARRGAINKHKKRQERLRQRFYSKRLRYRNEKNVFEKGSQIFIDGKPVGIARTQTLTEIHQSPRKRKINPIEKPIIIGKGRIKRAIKRGRMR